PKRSNPPLSRSSWRNSDTPFWVSAWPYGRPVPLARLMERLRDHFRALVPTGGIAKEIMGPFWPQSGHTASPSAAFDPPPVHRSSARSPDTGPTGRASACARSNIFEPYCRTRSRTECLAGPRPRGHRQLSGWLVALCPHFVLWCLRSDSLVREPSLEHQHV